MHPEDRLIKNRLPVLSNSAVLSRARICKINLGEPARSRKGQERIDKIAERERERERRERCNETIITLIDASTESIKIG